MFMENTAGVVNRSIAVFIVSLNNLICSAHLVSKPTVSFHSFLNGATDYEKRLIRECS